VPLTELAAITAAGTLIAEETEQKVNQANLQPLTYKRKGTGWESFLCSCGKLLQISPMFSASHIDCNDCGRKIEIIN
jgi:hypothetical protein